MLEVVTEVDGRPLSRLDCDGVICATPTGSTAYAFSAGGPVVWPEVEALLLVPICAHALFAGPMVIAPSSTLAVEVIGGSARTPVALPGLGVDTGRGRGEVTGAVLWCDGRRRVELPPGSRVEVRRGARPVLLARLNRNETDIGAGAGAPFTDRLVAKFELPVTGWRGRQAARAPGSADSGRAAQGEPAPGEDGTAAPGQAAGGAAGSDEEEASRADA
jgi:NAD+ kinase